MPPKVHACALDLTRERADWLQQLDRNPKPLLDHLAQRGDRRLGLYFESLWHFFLTEDARTELVAHNLPVQSGGQTAGEFDVLYYCHERKRHCHLELAVKYFLGTDHDDRDNGSVIWLGPDSRDRLDLKLQHMLQRQVQLGDIDAARKVLQDLDIHNPDKEIALHGYLFTPAQQKLPWPKGHVPAAKCHWLHSDHLSHYLPGTEACAFLILPRLRWLSPAVVPPGEPCLSAHELERTVKAQLAQRARPLLIAALDLAGRERERFFVTPSQWPETPTAIA